MIDYHLVHLYTFYRLPVMQVLRLFVFLLLLALIFAELNMGNAPRFSLFLVNIFIMHELFYRFKICRLRPQKIISEANENVLSASTLPVLAAYFSSETAFQMVQRLLNYEQVKFLFERMGFTPDELTQSTKTCEQLVQFAHKVVSQLNGKHITSMDVVSAYLLFNEDDSRLLFKHKLKEEEIFSILSWARLHFPYEEKPQIFSMHVAGGGIGDSLTSGWTLETKKYTKDFTLASLYKNPHLFGREKEFATMQAALLKKENNNVLLVGEMGGGKEALVEKLAIASFSGQTEKGLRHKRILEVMVGPLIAGATDRGQLEARLQALIEEVSHAGNIILYIPEFQDLLGSSSFAMNLSGALYPYLKDGKLSIIATITDGKYKQFLEGNPLTQVFSVVHVDSPLENVVEIMLMEKAVQFEEKDKVIIPYIALKAVIQHANRYNVEAVLPGSGVTLLEDVVGTVVQAGQSYYGKTKRKIVTVEDVISQVENKTSAVLSAPDEKEKELLLHLEEKLHARVIGQHRAIQVISEAIRRLRSGMVTAQRPISFLFLGPTGVGKTETARALADLYYGGEKDMIRLDMSEYADELGERRLLGAPPGEGEERGELTEKVRDNPNSLILLDEFEKAHPRILDLFLQVLEDGRLTDNKGRTVSFVNSLIIATSNAGSEFIRQQVTSQKIDDKDFEKQFMDHLQSQHLFKPELLNRFDDIVTFHPLGQEELTQIVGLLVEDVKKRLSQQDISLTFDPEVLSKIAIEGVDPQFGARPLRRFIQDKVEDIIASKMLQNNIKRGDSVRIFVSPEGSFEAEVKVIS